MVLTSILCYNIDLCTVSYFSYYWIAFYICKQLFVKRYSFLESNIFLNSNFNGKNMRFFSIENCSKFFKIFELPNFISIFCLFLLFNQPRNWFMTVRNNQKITRGYGLERRLTFSRIFGRSCWGNYYVFAIFHNVLSEESIIYK